MAKEALPTVIEYENELEDDFAGVTRETIRIGADFPYLHKNPLWNLSAAVVYRGIMTPFAYLYCKCKFRLRIVGREKLKKLEGGYFLYGNHTLLAGDAFVPNLVSFPTRNYVVVGAANLSVKGARNWTQMSGALPIPTELSGMRPFLSAMQTRIEAGHCITVYPEAHIWPYYTGIRPFGAAAFRYPVRFSKPVFCTTVTYSARKRSKTPRITVYVDGPFFADPSLPTRVQEKALRDAVYGTMCERAKLSTYAPVTYRKKEAAAKEGEV